MIMTTVLINAKKEQCGSGILLKFKKVLKLNLWPGEYFLGIYRLNFSFNGKDMITKCVFLWDVCERRVSSQKYLCDEIHID